MDNSQLKTGLEERMWIRDRRTLELITSARLDFYAVKDRHGLVLDWKTGFKGAPPSELSWQSKTQAVCLWHTFPDIVHVRAGFASGRTSPKLDLTDYTLSDLEQADLDIRNVVRRTKQPDAPRVPGPWCRYCRAQGMCRENAVYAMIVSGAQPLIPNSQGGLVAPDWLDVALAVGRMTPSEMGYVFRHKSTVTAVFESIEARLKGLPEAELQQAGYKLVPGNNNKEIVDPVLAFSRLGSLLTDEERMRCIKVVRGKASEILADRKRISTKEADALLLRAFGDAVRDKPGSPKLKPL